MRRFLAGLACGATIVGAGWLGHRAGYQQGKADLLDAQALAAKSAVDRRHTEPEPRDDEHWVLDENPPELAEGSDCLLATIPPKPCSELEPAPERSEPEPEYRHGAQRRARPRLRDDGGPWKTIPAPWITAKERAELVRKLEAKDRGQLEGGPR